MKQGIKYDFPQMEVIWLEGDVITNSNETEIISDGF